MSILAVCALAAGVVALLRYVAALPFLMRYLRRARVKSIPKGPTPPLTLYKGTDDSSQLGENLRASLRQNYPEFELRPIGDGAAICDSVRGEHPELGLGEMAALDEPAPAKFVLAHAAARPDPLYLRDAANGLEEGEVVGFPPIHFGLKRLGSRLFGLSANVEFFLTLLFARGRIVSGATAAFSGADTEAGGVQKLAAQRRSDVLLRDGIWNGAAHPVLARRAVRCYTPDLGLGPAFRRASAMFTRVRASHPALFLLWGVHAFAPALLVAAAVWTSETYAALALLGAHTLLRCGIAAVLDFRFSWDRSLVGSLRFLPLHWIFDPAAFLTGAVRPSRSAVGEQL